MTRLLICVAAILMSVSTSALQLKANPESAYPQNFTTHTQIPVQKQVEIIINLGDISDKSGEELSTSLDNVLEPFFRDLPNELQCKVSVKGTVNIGVAKAEITVEVSGPCSEVRAKGKEIANQILKEVKEALLN